MAQSTALSCSPPRQRAVGDLRKGEGVGVGLENSNNDTLCESSSHGGGVSFYCLFGSRIFMVIRTRGNATHFHDYFRECASPTSQRCAEQPDLHQWLVSQRH